MYPKLKFYSINWLQMKILIKMIYYFSILHRLRILRKRFLF